MSSAENHALEVDCHTVKQLLDENHDFVLVDCRERDEYEQVCLQAAVLLPMSELQARVNELDEHRRRRIVVHCHLGGRSLKVAMWLRQQGFSAAQSMAGGIDAWAQQIDTSLPRY